MHPLNLDLRESFKELVKVHGQNEGLIIELMGKALESRGVSCVLKGLGYMEKDKWRAGLIRLQVEDGLWSGRGHHFPDWDFALVELMDKKIDFSTWKVEVALDLAAGEYQFYPEHREFLQALDREIARREAWQINRDTSRLPQIEPKNLRL